MPPACAWTHQVVKRMQSVVLRQWACVSDLSKAIKDGVHELLGNQVGLGRR